MMTTANQLVLAAALTMAILSWIAFLQAPTKNTLSTAVRRTLPLI